MSCSWRIFFIISLNSVLLYLTSCSETPEPEPLVNAPVCVGEISKVFPEHQFVLIKSTTLVPIPEKDTVLLAQDPNSSRIANLVTSGERLSGNTNFPADIRSGVPEKGDKVFLYESLENGKKGVTITKPKYQLEDNTKEKINFPALDAPEKNEFPEGEELDKLLDGGETLPQNQ